MKPRPLYQIIAEAVSATKRSVNIGFVTKWDDLIEDIEKNHLPSGSGIDGGCVIDRANCTDQKIVITSSFHLMNNDGYYVGWKDFRVIITPSFSGIDLKIVATKSDTREIHRAWTNGDLPSYLGETFDRILRTEYDTEIVNHGFEIKPCSNQ